MIGNYGAGYLPTGAASSPGLYNMALVNQGWLPSWANLKGGILGPLYSPQITDPAVIEAIKNGAWNFPMRGSMFDPQGNYERDPLPDHFYSGRSMTLHGFGGYGGPLAALEAPTGLALAGALAGGFLAYQLFWAKHVHLGAALKGRAARTDLLIGAAAGALVGFLVRSRPAELTPSAWTEWVSAMPPVEKVVYFSALGTLGYTIYRALGIQTRARRPVYAVANRGKRRARKAKRYARRRNSDDGARYKIMRQFYDGRRTKAVRGLGNLTLAEAQAHCKDPKTKKAGVWFDGYTQVKTKRKR